MAQIGVAKTTGDLWGLVDSRCEEFAAAHAATFLHRLAISTLAAYGDNNPDRQLLKHASFVRLQNRLDDLLATAEGRASFLPADLALCAMSLAKIVPQPANQGATGRIFADIADEAEARIIAEPLAFMTPMLSDLAWGIAKSGNANTAFLRAVAGAATRKLSEMSCQDLANLAGAYSEQTADEAEDLLRGVFGQAKQRLRYQPQAVISPLAPPVRGVQHTGVAPSSSTVSAVGVVVDAVPVGDIAAAALDCATASGARENGSQETPPWQLTGQWKFNPTQISEIASAISRHVVLYEEEFFAMVAQQFLPRLHEFALPQLNKLRDAFELVRHDCDIEFARALRAAIKQRGLRRTPCQNFRLGLCKFAERCVYSHV